MKYNCQRFQILVCVLLIRVLAKIIKSSNPDLGTLLTFGRLWPKQKCRFRNNLLQFSYKVSLSITMLFLQSHEVML